MLMALRKHASASWGLGIGSKFRPWTLDWLVAGGNSGEETEPAFMHGLDVARLSGVIAQSLA